MDQPRKTRTIRKSFDANCANLHELKSIRDNSRQVFGVPFVYLVYSRFKFSKPERARPHSICLCCASPRQFRLHLISVVAKLRHDELARKDSGAEATAVQTLARLPSNSKFREAFGLQRVHRRFSP
jgi:hypothetical protein